MSLSEFIVHLVTVLADYGDYDIKIENSHGGLINLDTINMCVYPNKKVIVIS